MAEKKDGGGGDRFAYKTMASIVHKQDRKDVIRDEPTGESERVTTSQLQQEMGSALVKQPSSLPAEQAETRATSKKRKAPAPAQQIRIASSNYEELLRVGGSYEPTTVLTQRVWEQFLGKMAQLLPSVERDVLRSAAEESLNVLKSSAQYTIAERRTQLERLLDCKPGTLGEEDLRALLTCAEQLTDFIVQTQDSSQQDKRKPAAAGRDVEIAIMLEDETGEMEELGEEFLDEVASSESEEEEEQQRPKTADAAAASRTRGEESEDESLIDPITIDAFWLTRELQQQDGMDDAEAQALGEEVFALFGNEDVGQVENHLVALLGFDRVALVKRLLKNRVRIYFCIRLARCKNELERDAVRQDMLATLEGQRILDQLAGTSTLSKKQQPPAATAAAAAKPEPEPQQQRVMPSGRPIDLAALSRLTSTQLRSTSSSAPLGEVLLPKGSWHRTTKHFEEVHVQPAKARDFQGEQQNTVKIADLAPWMRPAFRGMMELNLVQSKVYPAILAAERFNILVSAPTSAGKTNIAMLAILREMAQFCDDKSGSLDIPAMQAEMKIVYVAPMKALVQEVVTNFSARLGELGIAVRELSGDSQLTRQQIKETQLLVTTPEKWDVVSRKAGERSFVSQVKLVIVDEIHLLNDTRGAVLEALIARILYTNETAQREPAAAASQANCRLLGISATLPNYVDVANFLRVPLDRGLFYFDSSYRPVPLHQVFIGVTDQKAINRAKQMDQICFDKASDAAKREHQVLIFVHSRKATFRLAKLLQQRAEERDEIDAFLPASAASREILLREECKSSDLKHLLAYGLAIHHAGMTKQDRTLVEDLFAAGHVRVLVSTATLAWGVNLPAHTVIIAGTQVYNPERAGWAELPQLDLLQMLGRAGRPQFDTEGEGLVITTLSEMHYYLSLCNNQLQVESSLLQRLPEHINAEIVIGNISSLREAVDWLRYTYLYSRAKQVPARYGVPQEDGGFEQWQVDVCHAALRVLEGMNLVHYDARTFAVQGTALGRITSHYYLSPETMSNFVKVLDAGSNAAAASPMDLLRILTVADEFKQITVRAEEKLELVRLAERVPIPIKESLEEPSAKVNVLLQAYISNWALDGYCLRCDLIYIHQSASRLARALFEICLHKRLASAALNALALCQSLDRKLWKSQSALRQLSSSSAALDEDILCQLERKTVSFARFRELSPAELAALIKNGSRGVGAQLHQAIHRFPKLDLAARVQTLARTSLKLDIAINADFEFDEDTLGGTGALLFWVLVLDADGQDLFHAEPFVLKSRFALEEHLVSIVLTDLPAPLPMFLLVKVESDAYLHCSASLAVPLHSLVQPQLAPPFSELLDLSPLQCSALQPTSDADFFTKQGLVQFWPSQTQSYSLLRQQDDNVLLAMPIGKTALAELAMLRALEQDSNARILYLTPVEDALHVKHAKWSHLFTCKLGVLTGLDANSDLKTLQECNIILSTAKTFEVLSRRWKQNSRRALRELSLVVADELQLANVELEVCLSRLRYMVVHLERAIRMVGLCGSVLDADDLAAWLGNAKLVSLPPSARPVPTELALTGFAESHFETRQGLMIRPAYRAIRGALLHDTGGRVFVFCPSKKHLKLALIDFIQFLRAEATFQTAREPAAASVSDALLRTALQYGMGIVHENMNAGDLQYVQDAGGDCRVVLICARALWRLRDDFLCTHALLMGTSWFHNRRFEEYPLHLVQRMLNRAAVAGPASRCLQTVYCFEPHKRVLKRGLTAAVCLESDLWQELSNVLLGEMCTSKIVQSKQDAVDYFTWTFFYRRLLKNPSYYHHSMNSSSDVSTFLSEIVDKTVEELVENQCLEEAEVESDALVPTSLGMIAAFHDIKCDTMELFATTLDASGSQELKLTRVFELVSSASEFLPTLGLRPREEFFLEALARNAQCVSLPLPEGGGGDFTETHIKVNILLQTWCNDKTKLLQVDERGELSVYVLRLAPQLLHALVDLCSSHGWLRASVLCLEACQTIVQQVWQTQSPLKQIPHFDQVGGERAGAQLRNVYDLIEMEDEARTALFAGMEEDKIRDIAAFCNAYPSVQVTHQCLVDGVETSTLALAQTLTLVVSLDMGEEEEEEGEGVVVSRHFPHHKSNLWWALLGEEAGASSSTTLLAIKRINNKRASLSCDFATPGVKTLQLIVMCDSYLGCDQSIPIKITVLE